MSLASRILPAYRRFMNSPSPWARQRAEDILVLLVLFACVGLPSLGVYEAIRTNTPEWLFLLFFLVVL